MTSPGEVRDLLQSSVEEAEGALTWVCDHVDAFLDLWEANVEEQTVRSQRPQRLVKGSYGRDLSKVRQERRDALSALKGNNDSGA